MTNDAKSLFERQVGNLISSGEVIEAYRDRIAREAIVGRVLQCSRHVCLMAKIDEVCRYDGLAAFRVGDVTRIRSGGRELRAETARWPRHPATQIPDVGLLEISAAITILNREFGHVSLRVEGLDAGVSFVGQVLDLDDDYLLLREYGTVRTMDRSDLLLRLGEITRVDAGGQYESMLVGRFNKEGTPTVETRREKRGKKTHKESSE